MPILFFSEDIDFTLDNAPKTSSWIEAVIEKESRVQGDLNFIFCSDNHLYQMNVDYLNHDTYTDIITFDNSEKVEEVSGDIFISVDRVRENAENLNTSFDDELHRVIIHGVLHLIGFNDKTNEEQQLMTEKEDASLSLR